MMTFNKGSLNRNIVDGLVAPSECFLCGFPPYRLHNYLVPLVIFVIFGLQRVCHLPVLCSHFIDFPQDVVNVILFRKRTPPPTSQSPEPVLSHMSSVIDIT
jgi:hypothetical protein